MKIKINKTHENAIIPHYLVEGDVGLDLTAVEVEKSGNWLFPLYTYRTGLSIELPKTHFAMLTPRSSLSKKLMWMANHVGVIDSGYRGELIFKFRGFLGLNTYKVGDRIGQILLFRRNKIEFVEVEKLSTTQRGSNGFGSTGV